MHTCIKIVVKIIPMTAMNYISTAVFCLFLLLAGLPVFADTSAGTTPPASFSIGSPQRLEIQSMLDSLDTSAEIESIVAYRTRILEYISINRQKAAQIEKEISQLDTALKGVVDHVSDQQTTVNSALSSLITMKQEKERELVELRLLIITGEEAVAQLNQYIREREARNTYFREDPLWRLIAVPPESTVSDKFYNGPPAEKNSSVILFTAFLSGLFLFLAAVPRITHFIEAQGGARNFNTVLLRLIAHTSYRGRSILLAFTALSAMVPVSFFIFSQWPLAAIGIQVVFFYLVLRLVLHALTVRFQFIPPTGPDSAPPYKPGWAHYAFSMVSGVIVASALGFGSIFGHGNLSIILDFIFFSGWLLLLFLFCRRTVDVIRPGILKYCQPVLLIVLPVLVLLEVLGYRNLNEHLAAILGHSFIIFCTSLIIYDSINPLMVLLQKFTTAVLRHFSLEPAAPGPEDSVSGVHRLFGIGLKIYAVIVGAALIFHRWTFSGRDEGRLLNYFINGWNIGGFTISPARLTLGIFLFALAWPAVGYLKQLIDRHLLSNCEMSSSSRDTVLTLAGYGGFAAVIIISLATAGVNLTGVTVIIGALSVGIGFGLQNVVNNFISGLILMFERPIKKGDWIQVGTTEGYVKKISIRSTIVQTFDRSDVIVPNSELISSQVTNMMLDDQRGRLRISVGVAYGSDTELVQRLLLEVANSHDQVITDGSTPEPRAFFQAFGESSLDFDLLAHLKDVDMKIRVRSELHTMIDKAFRTHGIEIPFPQRDIHLKSGAPLQQSSS